MTTIDSDSDMAIVEEWRKECAEASSLGGDPLQNVMTKAFELMSMFVHPSPDSIMMERTLASLKSEQELCMSYDKNCDDKQRRLTYGILYCLRLTLNKCNPNPLSRNPQALQRLMELPKEEESDAYTLTNLDAPTTNPLVPIYSVSPLTQSELFAPSTGSTEYPITVEPYQYQPVNPNYGHVPSHLIPIQPTMQNVNPNYGHVPSHLIPIKPTMQSVNSASRGRSVARTVQNTVDRQNKGVSIGDKWNADLVARACTITVLRRDQSMNGGAGSAVNSQSDNGRAKRAASQTFGYGRMLEENEVKQEVEDDEYGVPSKKSRMDEGGDANGDGIMVVKQSKRRSEKPLTWSKIDMQCTQCTFTTNVASKFITHMREEHKMSLTQAHVWLRCECGNECRTARHAYKSTCECESISIVTDEEKKREDEEEIDAMIKSGELNPECLICEKRPATIYAYFNHLHSAHMTTLNKLDYSLLCACGRTFISASTHTGHKKLCKGDAFLLRKVVK